MGNRPRVVCLLIKIDGYRWDIGPLSKLAVVCK